MSYTLIDHTQDKEKHFEDKKAAQDNKAFLVKEYGNDVEIVENSDDTDEKIVDHTTDGGKVVNEVDDAVVLRENPIEYLRGVNPEFVNTIKGTPAISKRGFRFIQVHLGISTTSEVVATFDNPRGVIVHARAELPDGRYAEAHGEGYAKGDKPGANEFTRYADSRAKNRALSDLTSSGALAESELE